MNASRAVLWSRAGTTFVSIGRFLPGLLLSLVLAVISTIIGRVLPIIGSAVPAVVLGAVVATVRHPTMIFVPGIAFTGRRVLQVAVVLLGLRLSLPEVVSVGAGSLPVMLATLAACLTVAYLAGRILRISGDLRTLIGCGTGICGASAIAAVAPVVGAESTAIAYSVSTIFVFNIAAVVVFPIIGHALSMSSQSFGLFAGTAVNDTSSVVAAASAFGSTAADYAVVVKLVRTLMIIPIVLALAILRGRHRARFDSGDVGPQRMTSRQALRLVPWFLIGFVLAAAVNSVGLVPSSSNGLITIVATFMISTAMAAIGMSADVGALRRTGARPLVLGAILWITVMTVSLGIEFATTGL